MESDRVQAGGGDLLCSESGGGVGEAGELDWTRLDSYPPSMMDGSPCRSGLKAKKKNVSHPSLSSRHPLCQPLAGLSPSHRRTSLSDKGLEKLLRGGRTTR